MDYNKSSKSKNTYKKDGITYVTLDESISWHRFLVTGRSHPTSCQNN